MKKKKIIAPIIITILLLIYFSIFIFGVINIDGSLWIKVTVLVILLGLMGGSIFVLVERIKEIRSGEEDDLGKYWLLQR